MYVSGGKCDFFASSFPGAEGDATPYKGLSATVLEAQRSVNLWGYNWGYVFNDVYFYPLGSCFF